MTERLLGSDDRLASARAKIDRAKTHVEDLRSQMREAYDGEAPAITKTRREYDPDLKQVLFIAERLPEIRDEWSLLIGDALHNFRCALDHLWWQLAIDHLGRRPTEKEAGRIQFPIIDAEADWAGHRFLKYVGKDAADKAKTLQAYDRGENESSTLSILGSLSNLDKHREVHLAFFFGMQPSIVGPSSEDCIDCERPSRTVDGHKLWEIRMVFGKKGPWGKVEVGDVVFGMPIVPTGPNPDIDIEPTITGQITLHDGRPILPLLDHFGNLVTGILSDFAPDLRLELPEGFSDDHA